MYNPPYFFPHIREERKPGPETMSVTELKHNLCDIVRQIQAGSGLPSEVIVTRRGKPVARLVPYEMQE